MHRIGAPSGSRLPRRSRLVPPARSYLLVRRQATCHVPPSTRETPPIHPAPRPPTRPHRHDHREGGGLPCRVRAPACARVRAREAGRRLRGPADLLQRHRAMARRRVSDRIRFPPQTHPGANARGKDTQCRHLSGNRIPASMATAGRTRKRKMPTGMSIRSKTRTLTQDRMTTTKTNTTQRTKRLPRLARRPFVATRST